ncbi:hypothetical protein [Streptomyces sp. N50]|uniref:hypothetical protein n=1 Tax=Streptomyces sp. N50 TaxID=3081765 RepID=UPI0029624017|nr:hypothetical protein [Streptomyces sp. N50]WOX12571.1 hypothetical protein R2B38_28730 [Streptomyces sp. N50]
MGDMDKRVAGAIPVSTNLMAGPEEDEAILQAVPTQTLPSLSSHVAAINEGRDVDSSALKEVLARAARRNRAALDRLAR